MSILYSTPIKEKVRLMVEKCVYCIFIDLASLQRCIMNLAYEKTGYPCLYLYPLNTPITSTLYK